MAGITRKARTIALVAGGLAVVTLVAAALPVAAQVRGALRGRRALTAASTGTTPLEMLSELLAKLDLTDAQRQQIKGIIGAHKDDLLAVAAGERSSRTALRAAIRQPALDTAGVTAAAAVVARADVQLSLQRAAIFSEVYAVLTDAQRQELATFVADAKAKIRDRLASLAGGEHDPATMLAQRPNRLGLTDDQKAQVKEIFAAHKTTLAAILTTEVATRTTLAAAIHQPSVDSAAVRRSCTAVAATDLQLDLERARIYAEVWAVLTPDQQDQLAELVAAVEARVEARVDALLNIFKVLF